MMLGLVRRYGRWQARDYFVERGAWTAAIGLAILAVFWLNYSSTPPVHLTDPSFAGEFGGPYGVRARSLAIWLRDEPKRFADGVEVMFGALGFIGTLIATHGIVSRDREHGYYRFLFAKSVNMPAYYAQAFAISGAGLLAVSAGVLGVTALAFGRAVPLSALGLVGAEFALGGGVVFLLSALWRFDFVIAALTIPVAALVSGLANEWRGGRWWARVLEPVLPPVESFGRFAEAITGPALVQAGDPAAVFGYGAICFALGLVALRRRAGVR